MDDEEDVDVRELLRAGKLLGAWQALRRAEPTEDDALAALAYEVAASGRYRQFAFDLAVDLFTTRPEPRHAINLSNVIGLLGDEALADEVNALIEGLAAFDQACAAATAEGINAQTRAGQSAAHEAMRVDARGIHAVVDRARIALGLAETKPSERH